jgi:hypothetical protein
MKKLTLDEYMKACRRGVNDRIKYAQDEGYKPNPPNDPQKYEAWHDGWREHGLTLRRPEVRNALTKLAVTIGATEGHTAHALDVLTRWRAGAMPHVACEQIRKSLLEINDNLEKIWEQAKDAATD